MRRCGLFLLAVLLLGACSASQVAIFSPGGAVAESSAARYEQLSRAGAPAIVVSVEKEQHRFAVFQRLLERDGVGYWVSSNNVSLSLQDGFLIATRGFGGDLMTADISAIRGGIERNVPGDYTRFQSYLDGENRVIIRSLVCRIGERGLRNVNLGSSVEATRMMEERCQSTDLSFVNLYWVDLRTGEIRQSRQWASPWLGSLAIRQIPR